MKVRYVMEEYFEVTSSNEEIIDVMKSVLQDSINELLWKLIISQPTLLYMKF